ncbi:hypothetical protein D3C81_2149820 [compost metagenome]
MIPHIREILETEDGDWKYFVLTDLLSKLPQEVLNELIPDLMRMANNPSQIDIASEVDEVASNILKTLEKPF